MTIRPAVRGLTRAIDRDVEALYLRAGASLSLPPGPGALALRLLGEGGVDYDIRRHPPRAELCAIPGGGYRILVSPDQTDESITSSVALELARWSCLVGLSGVGLKCLRLLAAHIVLPAPALAMAREMLDIRGTQLATAFVCPRAMVAIRLHECMRRAGQSGEWSRGTLVG